MNVQILGIYDGVLMLKSAKTYFNNIPNENGPEYNLEPLRSELESMGIDSYINLGFGSDEYRRGMRYDGIAVVRFKNENDMNLYKLSGQYADCIDVKLMIGCNDYE